MSRTNECAIERLLAMLQYCITKTKLISTGCSFVRTERNTMGKVLSEMYGNFAIKIMNKSLQACILYFLEQMFKLVFIATWNFPINRSTLSRYAKL